MINVTRTYLPRFEEFADKIKRLWRSYWITNDGEFVQLLEEKLKEYLGVEYIVLTANGTLALQVSYRLFNLKNEVVTTPFSFVATTSSIVWEGLIPIFADINPRTLTISPVEIEKKITDKTSAVVPVHVYGNACEIERIEEIAKRYDLKVIYDAAHCFGVEYKNKSILNYGDAAILSFHATKTYHTIEGGAIILHDENDYIKAKKLVNFGYEQGEIKGLGINAKMNEFEAAMGLCILDDIDKVIEKRGEVYKYYRYNLQDCDGVEMLELNPKITKYNYAYFPIILKSEERVLEITRALNEENIFPRRYFYPSLDTLNYIRPKQYMGNSRYVSRKVLCLPIFAELSSETLDRIIKIIKERI